MFALFKVCLATSFWELLKKLELKKKSLKLLFIQKATTFTFFMSFYTFQKLAATFADIFIQIKAPDFGLFCQTYLNHNSSSIYAPIWPGKHVKRVIWRPCGILHGWVTSMWWCALFDYFDLYLYYFIIYLLNFNIYAYKFVGLCFFFLTKKNSFFFFFFCKINSILIFL